MLAALGVAEEFSPMPEDERSIVIPWLVKITDNFEHGIGHMEVVTPELPQGEQRIIMLFSRLMHKCLLVLSLVKVLSGLMSELISGLLRLPL